MVSPGIRVREFNLDLVVPAVSSTTGALAGVFRWGPVGVPSLIDSEAALAARYGRPSDLNGETWFSAQSFLAYGAPIWISRAANTITSNGTAGALTAIANTGAVSNLVAQVVLSDDDYVNKDGDFDTNVVFVARYPGALGNSLRVSAVYSATDYGSAINLASFGNTGATLSVNVGSNTAVITLTDVSVTAANTDGQNLAAKIAVTDVLEIGNTTVGKQRMKVTGALTVNAQGNTTAGNCTITVPLEDPLSLHTDYSSAVSLTRYWEFYSLVGVAPGQSQFVLQNGNTAANDQMHLVVVDDGGKFTGVPGTVLEVFKSLSRAVDAKGLDNGSIYAKTVINQQSQYIRWANDLADAPSANAATVASSSTTEPVILTLNSGADGADEDTVPVSVLAAAWDIFRSKDDYDVSLLVTGKARGGIGGEQMANYLIDNIAEPRMDCVVYASPEQDDVVNNRGNELADVLAFNNNVRDSSYCFVDTGYKQQYDQYNDVYRWVPLCGDCAGLTARTDYTNDPWWAPAGFNRGALKNVVRLAYSPNQADRDVLYPVGVNPVVNFKGQGVTLFGNRTRLNVVSAFQDLNIRRLFIVLEKAISEMAKAFLFEFNDPFTQAQFRNTVTPYLRDVQGRRGIRDFRVRCDSTNNTDEVIRQDRFVGDIIVLPNRAIAFISLNFVAVGTSVTFSEIQSQNIQF